MAQDTAAKDAIVRISAYSRQTGARPPPPERTGAFTMKTEENNGVIAMIDELIAGLDKEMTVRKPREGYRVRLAVHRLAEQLIDD